MMKLKITKVRDATPSEWDTTWLACDWSTYFHSREWAEIWDAYTKGAIRPSSVLFTFSDGKEVLLPASSERGARGWTSICHLSPALTFGGWISAEYINMDHARLIEGWIKKNYTDVIWRLNPYDNITHKLKIKVSRTDETLALDLKKGMDEIRKGWTKGHRSAVTKAEREGIRVRQAITLEDWQAYYRVYEDSLRRWAEKASSRYGLELFECMFKRQSLNIRLWLGRLGDDVISGALCFYAKKHVVYWHGATLEKFFELRPSNLVVAKAIEDACNRGYKWFDFNPSGGHEGVRSFKRSFGAVAYRADMIVRASLKSRILGALLACYRLVKR